jgi:hypothetical protein
MSMATRARTNRYSVLLECGIKYRDLVGCGTSKDVNTDLRHLDLGKSVTDATLRKLAAYVNGGSKLVNGPF